MKTPNEVLIAGERHLIIHGQLGNLGAKLSQLWKATRSGGHEQIVPMVEAVEYELDYLKKVYPQLDGSFSPATVRVASVDEETDSPKINKSLSDNKIRNALGDMRVLMDAAALSFQHDGNISCHLKVMLDEAWAKAADQVGLGVDSVDGIPF